MAGAYPLIGIGGDPFRIAARERRLILRQPQMSRSTEFSIALTRIAHRERQPRPRQSVVGFPPKHE
jgi:hypothetical protein